MWVALHLVEDAGCGQRQTHGGGSHGNWSGISHPGKTALGESAGKATGRSPWQGRCQDSVESGPAAIPMTPG